MTYPFQIIIRCLPNAMCLILTVFRMFCLNVSFDFNISCCSLLQDPFKSIPLIWTVQESSLVHCFSEYNSSGMIQILGGWKEAFSRADVIVFPNYILPVYKYSHTKFDVLVVVLRLDLEPPI